MDLWGNWSSFLSPTTIRRIDQTVSTAEVGDLIEFVHPWAGVSLWAVYVGEGHVIHFGVGDENLTQKVCRTLLQQMAPKKKADGMLRKTRICAQRITDIKVAPGTSIRVNNNKHNLVPSSQEMMRSRWETFLHQEFKYDLINFNSEHFATFVRYGEAVSNQIPFKKKNDTNKDTTQTLQMIMQQRTETES
ncbi:phospholipase A and acyltransferase 2-like [Acanthopagrus latus]|uniref:phospholipase A and acyltransferase 2-like n=1 Tax=Acanthopagrus latus TaxID=8177 RepID=UPI00187BEAAD|nr:phospholipase A and acyltransferase 2-like [Acanthopagrus latus]